MDPYPDAHPDLWEAATLNLANALQHLPSSHIKDNLAEAVSHYEALLERRTGRDEARARTLANLGNAVASASAAAYAARAGIACIVVVPAGKIAAGKLEKITERAEEEELGNIETVLGEIDDPRFPRRDLDMIIMVYVLHHLGQPLVFLQNLVQGREELTLNRAGQYCLDNLINRLYAR